MRWPSTIVIALICAALGTALALLLGSAITKAYRVSDFRGQGRVRDRLSLRAGGTAARADHRHRHRADERRRGHGALLQDPGAGPAHHCGGPGRRGRPGSPVGGPAPKLGNELNLEFEIRFPTVQPVPADLGQAEFRVSAYENETNNRLADLAFDQVTRDSAFVIVAGTAWIGAPSLFCMLSGGFGGGDSRVVEIRLAPGRTETDTAWTDWQRSRDLLGNYEARTGEPYQVRFRVAPVPPTA